MLHQGTGTGTGPAADINFTPGSAMTCRITGIPPDGYNAAGIQPAGISGYRAVRKNFCIWQAHGAKPLTGVVDLKVQGFPVLVPKGTADIMLSAGVDIKLRLTFPDCFLYFQQQILGRHTLMADKGFDRKHCFLSLPVSRRTECQAGRQSPCPWLPARRRGLPADCCYL